jgi:ribosomal protein L7/L12
MEQKNYNKLFKVFLDENNDNLENAILELKVQGASQIECIKALMAVLKISLSEADKIVLNSNAWSGEKGQAETFRENLGNFLDEE